MSSDPRPEPRETFESQLALIRELIQRIGRSHRLNREDLEDFSSFAYLRLIDHDYAILRKFRGRCRLRTFLITVIQRLFLDYQIHRWGKWRPSALAKHFGETGVRLEKLISRDGLPLEHALQILRSDPQIASSRTDLLEIARQLRQRVRPRFQDDEVLHRIPIDGRVEKHLLDKEMAVTLSRARVALKAALKSLPPEDRLILRMRYQNGFKVRQIAKVLHLEAPPLYSRIERCLRQLRAALERKGVTRADIMDLLGWEGMGAVLSAPSANRLKSGIAPPPAGRLL